MMATQATTEAPQEFLPFPKLPVEIQQQIWKESVLQIDDSIITFSLSDPEHVEHTEQEIENGVYDTHKHLFSVPRPSHPLAASLLLTCQESHDAYMRYCGKHFTRGFNVSCDGWGVDFPPGHKEYEPEDCSHDNEVEESNRHLLWEPRIAVALITHAEEPHGCSELSMCNAPNPTYAFSFDARLRFAAIPLDVWRAANGSERFTARRLKVLFVLVEDNVAEVARSEGYTEADTATVTETLDFLSTTWTDEEAMFTSISFTQEVEVKAVLSMEEVLTQIGT